MTVKGRGGGAAKPSEPAHHQDPAPAGVRALTHVENGPSSGLFDPALTTLPYLEFARALLRAHHNAMAMVEANRLLGDAMRGILRRQQDLAFELAEQALSDRKSGAPADGSANDRAFERAADAVKEIGQAMIDAQLTALQTLQFKAFEAEKAPSATAPVRN